MSGLAFVCLVVSLFGSIGPWLWIGLKNNTKASAWGTAPWTKDQSTIKSIHSMAFQENAAGRPEWFVLLLVCILVFLLYYIWQDPAQWLQIATSFAFCWLGASLTLFFAYRRIGSVNNVSLGLMSNFFIFGGVLGVCFAMIFEVLEEVSLQAVFPHCNMQFGNVHTLRGFGTVLQPLTPFCGNLMALMWILVPGLVEETGKAMWLFWRFRRSDGDIPNRCCFDYCASSHSKDCCGGWYKLAPTPHHVLLCALSAGAGFECLENLKYVFHNTAMSKSIEAGTLVEVAFARCATSALHIVWTGLIGLGLAKRLFYPVHARPWLPTVILPSIVLHGLFDFSLSLIGAVAQREKMKIIDADNGDMLMFFGFGILCISSFGSCIILGCLTGCRCGVLCCAPNFWPEDGSWASARERFAEVDPPVVACKVRLLP